MRIKKLLYNQLNPRGFAKRTPCLGSACLASREVTAKPSHACQGLLCFSPIFKICFFRWNGWILRAENLISSSDINAERTDVIKFAIVFVVFRLWCILKNRVMNSAVFDECRSKNFGKLSHSFVKTTAIPLCFNFFFNKKKIRKYFGQKNYISWIKYISVIF